MRAVARIGIFRSESEKKSITNPRNIRCFGPIVEGFAKAVFLALVKSTVTVPRSPIPGNGPIRAVARIGTFRSLIGEPTPLPTPTKRTHSFPPSPKSNLGNPSVILAVSALTVMTERTSFRMYVPPAYPFGSFTIPDSLSAEI